MAFDLPTIWGFLIAVAVLMYVLLDGFDLGVGILFPFIKDPRERDTMMASVAPVWDGNETWLILGGGGLFAVFPLAYSVLMTALYAPLIAMLLALIFRGVAFEFRHRDPKHKPYWDLAFTWGSILATFFQGIVLGAFISGIAVEGRSYAGGWFDWLTPFSVFTGLALIAGYGLLGSTWLVMKTEGDLQKANYGFAARLMFIVLGAIGIASLWTPFHEPRIWDIWFSMPNLLYLSPVPVLVLAAGFGLWQGLNKKKEIQPFLCSAALFLLSYIGLGISFFPYLVPPAITIYDAATPPESQGFLLVGALVLLPMVLGYTAYAYWVFRGKVKPDDGYH